MRAVTDRPGILRAPLLLLVLALAAYFVVIRAPHLALLAVVAAIAGLLLLSLINRSVFRDVALTVCALIILYPALMPRPAVDRIGVAHGGEVDDRASAQLIVLAALMALSAWLWLSTRGSAMIFTRVPFSLFAAYGAIILWSLSYTPDLAWAAYAALKLFHAVLALATVAVLVKTPRDLRRLIDLVLGSVVIVLLFYWFDILNGVARLDDESRWTTTWLAAPNASILAFTFTAVMGARFFIADSLRATAVAAAATGLGIVMGLLIGGKSALGAGLLALLAAAVAAMTRDDRAARRAALGKLALVGAGLVLASVYVVVTDMGLAAHVRTYAGNEYIDPLTLTGRVPVWAVAIQEGLRHPVFGHGYMSTFELGLDGGRRWVAPQAHNGFIQTFFDLGLLGLLPVLAIYFMAWRDVLRQVRTLPVSDARWAVSIELLAALTALTVVNFTEDILGGIFESRTMLLLLVVVVIHLNAPMVSRRATSTRGSSGAPPPVAGEASHANR